MRGMHGIHGMHGMHEDGRMKLITTTAHYYRRDNDRHPTWHRYGQIDDFLTREVPARVASSIPTVSALTHLHFVERLYGVIVS